MTTKKFMVKPVLMSIMTAVTATSVFTSCSEDDVNKEINPIVTTTRQSYGAPMQRVVDDLTSHPQVDLSNYLIGENGVEFFELRKDGTFKSFTVSKDVAEEQANNGTIVNEAHGKWTPFLSSGDDMEQMAGRSLQGFTAVFDQQGEDIDEATRTKTYYLLEVDKETGKKTIVNRERFTIAVINQFGSEMGAHTRGIGDWWDSVTGWFEDAWKAIKDTFNYIFGIDLTNETLDAAKCKQFYDAFDKGLNEIYKKFGKTDYNNWMKQIYTDKGKNPFICDMNIPGSHDSFTSYYEKDLTLGGLSDEYVKAQMLTIEQQWGYGVRYFDLRIANMKGLDWAHATEFKNDCLGLYHSFYLNITLSQGLDKISKLLERYPGETAIITLQVDGDTTEKILEMSHHLVLSYIEHGKAVRNPRSNMRLSDCAGKMIILQSWSPDTKDKDKKVIDPDHKYPSGPQIRGGDNEYIPDGAIYFEDQKVPLHYQNKYETTKGYYCDQFWKDKKEVITKCFEGIKNESNPLAWAVNQTSAFVGGELHMTYSKNANVMNPWMTQYVLKHKEDKMGIITCDFAGYDGMFDDYYCNGTCLPKAVVETNRFR